MKTQFLKKSSAVAFVFGTTLLVGSLVASADGNLSVLPTQGLDFGIITVTSDMTAPSQSLALTNESNEPMDVTLSIEDSNQPIVFSFNGLAPQQIDAHSSVNIAIRASLDNPELREVDGKKTALLVVKSKLRSQTVYQELKIPLSATIVWDTKVAGGCQATNSLPSNGIVLFAAGLLVASLIALATRQRLLSR